MQSTSTLITTAEGKTIEFAGAVAKFVVAHPRLSVWIALAVGGVIGHIV